MSKPEPARADARRNRDRILAVAYAALTDDPEVSLNAVAQRAGVGAGTLYRHFPAREDLLLAVYAHEVQALVDDVPAVLADRPPLDALRAWFLRLAGYVRVKHGLGEALHSATAQDVVAATYAPVTAAIGQLLDAGVATGDVRPGIDPYDLLLVMSALWRVGDGPEADERAARVLELAIAGIRAG